MNPKYPLYIVSKGRYQRPLTARFLDKCNIPYFIVVEKQERDLYAKVIDEDKILCLDTKYQDQYDTCDDLGKTKSKGPGPARNFVWDHSVSLGAKWHWVMDDNIRAFYRLNRNINWYITSGTIFRVMEMFCERYKNIVMAGPAYEFFTPRKEKRPAFVRNARIYSCNLIRNDIPYRWRGRYNEDTILSLDILKDGWGTVQFYAFLQDKLHTQTLKGGNTAEFYEKEGTQAKSEMLAQVHPDLARVTFKFNRIHHYVDYSVFKRFYKNRWELKDGIYPKNQVNNYGMVLKVIT